MIANPGKVGSNNHRDNWPSSSSSKTDKLKYRISTPAVPWLSRSTSSKSANSRQSGKPDFSGQYRILSNPLIPAPEPGDVMNVGRRLFARPSTDSIPTQKRSRRNRPSPEGYERHSETLFPTNVGASGELYERRVRPAVAGSRGGYGVRTTDHLASMSMEQLPTRLHHMHRFGSHEKLNGIVNSYPARPFSSSAAPRTTVLNGPCGDCHCDYTGYRGSNATAHLYASCCAELCLWCDKRFRTAAACAKHKDKRHYHCTLCGLWCFDLSEHNERFNHVKCTECWEVFKAYKQLRVHQRQVHGIECRTCGKKVAPVEWSAHEAKCDKMYKRKEKREKWELGNKYDKAEAEKDLSFPPKDDQHHFSQALGNNLNDTHVNPATVSDTDKRENAPHARRHHSNYRTQHQPHRSHRQHRHRDEDAESLSSSKCGNVEESVPRYQLHSRLQTKHGAERETVHVTSRRRGRGVDGEMEEDATEEVRIGGKGQKVGSQERPVSRGLAQRRNRARESAPALHQSEKDDIGNFADSEDTDQDPRQTFRAFRRGAGLSEGREAKGDHKDSPSGTRRSRIRRIASIPVKEDEVEKRMHAFERLKSEEREIALMRLLLRLAVRITAK